MRLSLRPAVGRLLCGLAQAAGHRVATPCRPKARETLALIDEGGPFPHQRDGIVFRNFEKQLPIEQRGYYREYTVAHPRAHASRRAAHRLRRRETRRPDACYYTADHYRSFRKITE